MTFRTALRLLAPCVLAIAVVAPACAVVKKPSNTYTMRIACFTATPKSPTLARAKGDFKDIIKQAPILPESGAPFVLDTSTPTRCRKQMEGASGSYGYALTVGGSVSCDSGAVCSINIAPSPDDLSKAQLSGEWSLTVKDPTTVNLDVKELILSLIPSGQTKLAPMLSVKATRTVALNRTYILSGLAKQQDKKTTLSIFAICIVPGGN